MVRVRRLVRALTERGDDLMIDRVNFDLPERRSRIERSIVRAATSDESGSRWLSALARSRCSPRQTGFEQITPMGLMASRSIPPRADRGLLPAPLFANKRTHR